MYHPKSQAFHNTDWVVIRTVWEYSDCNIHHLDLRKCFFGRKHLSAQGINYFKAEQSTKPLSAFFSWKSTSRWRCSVLVKEVKVGDDARNDYRVTCCGAGLREARTYVYTQRGVSFTDVACNFTDGVRATKRRGRNIEREKDEKAHATGYTRLRAIHGSGSFSRKFQQLIHSLQPGWRWFSLVWPTSCCILAHQKIYKETTECTVLHSFEQYLPTALSYNAAKLCSVLLGYRPFF